MTDVARPLRPRLSAEAAEHLHRLMAAWQLIADLAFADLLLFLPVHEEAGFRIVGQLRPYTARTLYPADMVGEVVAPTWHPYVERAWREGRRLASPEPIFIDAEAVRVETVPVRHRGQVVAVLSVESPETPARPTGRLEASYLGAADALLEMVAAGTFPFVEAHDPTASPRVGELARLRLCVSGSAPLPATLFERLAERGGQRILERYGMTETLMNVSNPHDGERRPGTVGLPLPGVELRLDNGEDGEVLLRGPNVFAGYWRDPEATAEAIDPGGWFHTGDLGSFDERGYLRIQGRTKELIITGGYNVHPREVEELLLEHPAVAEVAVVGTPSEEWGEVVTAFVVASGEPPPPDDLLAFTSGHLAPYKRPRSVRYVAELPRNALGKVQKHELGR
jgi:acyl-CoA synthetase (AMP-forming)/AMP-acid ligase II